ncbi:15448_t:CDS:2 [Dentiscutata erythropus]|uniref:15448_t:CDS:1 n=1 Tax=Dentiscutata erythropus TaxID=1348616 RepID=A0A9N9CNZ8_9GLOM|nr:15448_t:CDS:2 [Dentiscutata erythropus]
MSSIDLSFFDNIDAAMEEEAARKEEILRLVRDFDRTCRTITSILNRVHSAQAEEGNVYVSLDISARILVLTVILDTVPTVGKLAIDRFEEVKQHMTNLAKLVPHQQYYRYNELWSRTVQNSVFLAAFAIYLQYEKLITANELESLLGVKINLNNDLQDFHISLEEFLHSFITLTNELSRLAVNAVTVGDYNRPIRISHFVQQLYTGFQLLNLKNDALRRRFDGIKYNIKKIEEVVYDISLRKLSDDNEMK